jgi:hypothetical protein
MVRDSYWTIDIWHLRRFSARVRPASTSVGSGGRGADVEETAAQLAQPPIIEKLDVLAAKLPQ